MKMKQWWNDENEYGCNGMDNSDHKKEGDNKKSSMDGGYEVTKMNWSGNGWNFLFKMMRCEILAVVCDVNTIVEHKKD